MQTLTQGQNTNIPSEKIQVVVTTGKSADISSFRVYADGKTKVDDDFIFYGQVKNLDNTISCDVQNNETQTTFTLDLPRIKSEATKITFGATSNFPKLSELGFVKIEVKHGFMTIIQCEVDLNNRSELALILGEVYKHNGAWKFRFISQGFDGGLKPLAEFYGVNIADEEPANTTTNTTSTEKTSQKWLEKIPETKSGLDLRKNILSLDKVIAKTPLNNHKAQVVVVMDHSGSMRPLYDTGEVQKTLNRIMPLSLKFDDDGDLDVWLFHDDFYHIEPMNIQNYEDFVKTYILKKYRYGRTLYSPVLKEIMDTYFPNRKEFDKINPATVKVDRTNPVFVVFITDGNTKKRQETDALIRESAYYGIFIQFIGIGKDEEFKYLKKLDDLTNRHCDNIGFMEVENINTMDDEKLYKELLREYILWLQDKNN